MVTGACSGSDWTATGVATGRSGEAATGTGSGIGASAERIQSIPMRSVIPTRSSMTAPSTRERMNAVAGV